MAVSNVNCGDFQIRNTYSPQLFDCCVRFPNSALIFFLYEENPAFVPPLKQFSAFAQSNFKDAGSVANLKRFFYTTNKTVGTVPLAGFFGINLYSQPAIQFNTSTPFQEIVLYPLTSAWATNIGSPFVYDGNLIISTTPTGLYWIIEADIISVYNESGTKLWACPLQDTQELFNLFFNTGNDSSIFRANRFQNLDQSPFFWEVANTSIRLNGSLILPKTVLTQVAVDEYFFSLTTVSTTAGLTFGFFSTLLPPVICYLTLKYNPSTQILTIWWFRHWTNSDVLSVRGIPGAIAFQNEFGPVAQFNLNLGREQFFSLSINRTSGILNLNYIESTLGERWSLISLNEPPKISLYNIIPQSGIVKAIDSFIVFAQDESPLLFKNYFLNTSFLGAQTTANPSGTIIQAKKPSEEQFNIKPKLVSLGWEQNGKKVDEKVTLQSKNGQYYLNTFLEKPQYPNTETQFDNHSSVSVINDMMKTIQTNPKEIIIEEENQYGKKKINSYRKSPLPNETETGLMGESAVTSNSTGLILLIFTIFAGVFLLITLTILLLYVMNKRKKENPNFLK